MDMNVLLGTPLSHRLLAQKPKRQTFQPRTAREEKMLERFKALPANFTSPDLQAVAGLSKASAHALIGKWTQMGWCMKTGSMFINHGETFIFAKLWGVNNDE